MIQFKFSLYTRLKKCVLSICPAEAQLSFLRLSRIVNDLRFNQYYIQFLTFTEMNDLDFSKVHTVILCISLVAIRNRFCIDEKNVFVLTYVVRSV